MHVVVDSGIYENGRSCIIVTNALCRNVRCNGAVLNTLMVSRNRVPHAPLQHLATFGEVLTHVVIGSGISGNGRSCIIVTNALCRNVRCNGAVLDTLMSPRNRAPHGAWGLGSRAQTPDPRPSVF